MQCLDQDVEPCLRLGSLRHTGRLPMRKTLQSIIHHPCCIEPVDFKEKNEQLVPIAAAPSPKRSSWDSQTSLESEGILVCYGCGSEIKYHENQSLFRYRLDEINDEYCWIDQACRDRLVAVCNFYSFVRHIRSGLRNQSSIQELFDECIQLRLIMFYARAGVHYPDH
ncbi:uncharacterized protein BX663DRAFT_502722 [Cokeromyces recurvatus]|uniref:uncharacterized protein n=1 Tax=Cokeromyces recurvatus TaxID=90255 RepID=UPI0022209437|nr:uncharacterized protein BX663DRAFT_502722 [Cokeromyces recurvatus]KAI7904537.1 hypothetical protein BX663DRAFT_502722 [Cokeromyces recurvatus]